MKREWIRLWTLLAAALWLAGCTTAQISVTRKGLPKVYEDYNETYQIKRDIRVVLFRFENYTDAPEAGLRAANLMAGVLQAKGYRVYPYLKKAPKSLKKARKIAKKAGARYFMTGGVSEWRYKNGIDAEPAVSLRLTLYKTKNAKPVWSATGSDSDWGNATLGTTAQNLMKEMLER